MATWDDVDNLLAAMAERGGRIETKLDQVLAHLDESGTPTPPAPPVPVPPVSPSQPSTPSGRNPVDVLAILRDWTVTLPIAKPGSTDSPVNDYPDKLTPAQVAGRFYAAVDAVGEHVVFRLNPAGAVHTKNSKYGRSESREMIPGKRWEEAAWPSTQARVLSARVAMDTTTLAYQDLNALQIHDTDDDVMQVKLLNGKIGVSHNDGDSFEVLDAGYGRAGGVFDVSITTTGGKANELVIAYTRGPLQKTVRIPKTGTGWYFKAGAYANTGGANVDKPEKPDAVCEVRIYALTVT